ncbi:MAG: hypothetical protein NXI04_22075 [Planctomycetaceae bacterium]|nr:hypothetical protein [Planctomycetaceae bacterium]
MFGQNFERNPTSAIVSAVDQFEFSRCRLVVSLPGLRAGSLLVPLNRKTEIRAALRQAVDGMTDPDQIKAAVIRVGEQFGVAHNYAETATDPR